MMPDLKETILSEIQRLDVSERRLSNLRADTTYQLEQVLRERDRLRRHLEAVENPERKGNGD
jgi:predicted  nucleic acid-binding Zn-ribbon protein